MCPAPPRGLGGPGIARARRDLANAANRTKIHTGLSRSMWRGLTRPNVRQGRIPCSVGPPAFVCGACMCPLPPSEGRGSLELAEIPQIPWIARRFMPVCRSRCGAREAGRVRGGARSPAPLAHPPFRGASKLPEKTQVTLEMRRSGHLPGAPRRVPGMPRRAPRIPGRQPVSKLPENI